MGVNHGFNQPFKQKPRLEMELQNQNTLPARAKWNRENNRMKEGCQTS